jgi:hypothetical protein
VYLANVEGHVTRDLAITSVAARTHLHAISSLVGVVLGRPGIPLKKVKQRLRRGVDVAALFDADTDRPAASRGSGVGWHVRSVERLAGRHPFAVVPSALGRLLVAGFDRGVCAVAMGRLTPSSSARCRSIRRQRSRRPGWVEEMDREVLSHLAGGPRGWICRSASRHSVSVAGLERARLIPPGDTRSCAEDGRGDQLAGAARAVARVRPILWRL